MPSNLGKALNIMARYRPEFTVRFALDPSSVDSATFRAEFAKLPEDAKRQVAQLPTENYEHQDKPLGYFVARAVGHSDRRIRSWATIMMVLKARGIDVPEDARVRIIWRTELEQLDRLARRAATVNTIDELFD